MSHSLDQHTAAQHNVVRGSEIFVGGLARATTENKIIEVFSSCGEILEIRLIKDQAGTSKGYCFVRFGTKESADKALKDKAGVTIDGKTIGVRPSTEQDALYIGNIHKEWGPDEFEKVIRQAFKDVASLDLAPPYNSGDVLGQKKKNRGFAIVTFSSHAAAARAHRLGSAPDFLLGSICHPVVQWAELEPEIDPEELAKVKIAFVRNVPPDADERYLEKLFEPFGKVDKVVISKKTRSPVGFIYFGSRSDLDRAIKGMNGKTVTGPSGGALFSLLVEVARPSDKNKKRTRDDTQIEKRTKMPSHSAVSLSEPAITFGGTNYVTQDRKYLTETPASADPYEAAVVSLTNTVKERLLRILRLGIATRFDIGLHCLASLKELPESAAISVLDQFMLSGADKHNKEEYLFGLISRYQVNGLGRHSHNLNLSRIADDIPKESHVSRFTSRVHLLSVDALSNRAHLPSKDSLSSRAHLPSMDSLSSRAHLPSMDSLSDRVHRPAVDSLSSRVYQSAVDSLDRRVRLPDVGSLASRGNLTTMDSRGANLPVDSPSSHMRTSLSRYDTAADPYASAADPYASIADTYASRYTAQSLSNRSDIRRDEASPTPLHQPPVSSSAYSRLYSSPVTAVPDRQPTRPRIRFDPYTGEPYKFDPFTGEPIVPES